MARGGGRCRSGTPAAAPAASRTLERFVLWAALCAFTMNAAVQWRSVNPVDYYQMWVVGQAIAGMPVENVYGEKDRRAVNDEFLRRSRISNSTLQRNAAESWDILQTVASPFLFAAFYLTATGDFDTDYGRFHCVSVVSYVGGLVALSLVLGYPLRVTVLLVAVFTRLFFPFNTDTGFASVAQLQTGLLALLVVLLQRDSATRNLLGGAVAALLVLFKPTVAYAMALLLLLWLADRRVRRFLEFSAALAAVGIAGLLVPTLVFGDRCSWTSWWTDVPTFIFSDRHLAGTFLGKLVGAKNLTAYTLFALLTLSLTALSVLAVTRLGGSKAVPTGLDDYTAVAAGMCVYILTGPVVHSHYFLLAVPLCLLSVRPGLPPWQYALSVPAIFVVAQHPLLQRIGLAGPGNHSLWTFLGVWILFGLSLFDFGARRLRPAGAVPR